VAAADLVLEAVVAATSVEDRGRTSWAT